ncbi:MAG: DJ-1/PfpI family protein, partial [Lachnospiraceae bacterium]|nr:DJ-1/PfpI family protein [Lachnospiraceae bacterium]
LGLHAAGAYICAICAAPSVLAQLGLLDGKKATSYPSFEEKLSMADYQYDSVVVDGNIVTSRGVGTAIDFGLKLIELLKGNEDATEVAASIVYKP